MKELFAWRDAGEIAEEDWRSRGEAVHAPHASLVINFGGRGITVRHWFSPGDPYCKSRGSSRWWTFAERPRLMNKERVSRISRAGTGEDADSSFDIALP